MGSFEFRLRHITGMSANMIKRFNLLFVVLTFTGFVLSAQAQNVKQHIPGKKLAPLTGGVQENEFKQGPQVGNDATGFIKDSLTGHPISGAEVSIPDKGMTTLSRADGSFKLDTKALGGNFILSVKKKGYLPFALNAKKDDFSSGFNLHIEKQKGEVVIDSDIHHLGDNSFSNMSANAASFRLPAEGPTYIKEFYVESLPPKGMILKIGSIIGLDTIASKEIGQSHIDSFSSPLSIYVNSIKIAEIAINADNKVIPIRKGVLKPHSTNLLVFQTGTNQVVRISGSLDYDDIEFMNVLLEKVQ